MMLHPAPHASLRAPAYVALAGAAASFGAAVAVAAQRLDVEAAFILIAAPAAVLLAALVVEDVRIGVLAVFALFPLNSALASFGIASLQPVEALVIALAGLVVVKRLLDGRSPLPWPRPMWWGLALLAWSGAATVSALDHDLATKQLASLVLGLLLVCIVVTACKDIDDVRRIVGVLVLVATVVAAIALGSSADFRTFYGGSLVTGRSEGTFTQSNELGSFCVLTAFLAIGLALGWPTARGRIVFRACASILLAGTMLSLSRGAWIGMIGAMIVLVVMLPIRWRVLTVLGPALLVAVIAITLTSSNPLRVIQLRALALTAQSPWDNRTEIWAEARREIAAEPLMGYGPRNFQVASQQAASPANTANAKHAHNLLLGWAAEAGIPAALMILAFAIALVRTAQKAKSAARTPSDKAVIAGIAAALASVLIHGFFDYTLLHNVIWLSLWAVIGTLVAAGCVLGAERGAGRSGIGATELRPMAGGS